MPKINILPKSIAELIAAGEVVERPASVVKELVENSIDAGAKSVTVEIKNGGIRYIRVTDDGCGISPEDVPTAFVSHATSKIKSADDLNSILTLGFRGEALPSVAAVSRLSMLTRTEENNEGVLFTVEGGENANLSPAGCPVGTTITVRDLFFNTPARMKFLKKDVTEGSCVADIVTRAALAHPEVRFSLIRDGKSVLSTPGNAKLYDTVYSVFGKSVAEALIPCEYKGAATSVWGYISKPLNNRPNRNMQFFFVNGRNVRIPAAVPALDEAYKNSVMVGKFPMCFLNVTVAAEKIDVNVHPAKTEIRFSDETKIFETVYYAAKGALARGDSARPSIKLANPSVLDAPLPKTEQMSFSHRTEQSPAQSGKAGAGSAVGNTAADTAAKLNEKFTSYFADKEQKNGNSILHTRSSPEKSVSESPTADDTKVQTESQKEDGTDSLNSFFVLRSSDSDPISSLNEKREVSAATGYDVPWAKKTGIDIFVDDTSPSESEKKANDVSDDCRIVQNGCMVARSEVTQTQNAANVVGEKQENADTSCGTGGERNSDADFRVVGEIFKTYILAEKGSKLLIIDKHAAHERMIFNKMINSAGESYSQVLLVPVTVTLSGREYAAVTENAEIFAEAGFAVDDFGDGTVTVRECPSELTREDIPTLIAEIAGELLRGNTRARPEKLMRIRETAACRAAIKAGDSLKPEETDAFVKSLLADDSIKYCPHGRPVMYELSKHEIEKQFGRLG